MPRPIHRVRFAELKVRPNRAHVHVTRLGPGQRSQLHDHDFFEVFLVLQGTATHHLNGRPETIAAGDLVALGPSDRHCYTTAADGLLTFVNVAIAAETWTALRTLMGLPRNTEAKKVRLPPPLAKPLGRRLRQLESSDDPTELLQTWKTVTDALEPPRGPHPTALPAPPPWLETFRRDLAAMPEALGEPIVFWQQRCACSPEHLARVCRRHYGLTPSGLINAARVERAKYLLRATDRKIVSIAFESGFGNMANFHRTFARLVGMTPNAWRQAAAAVVPLVPSPGIPGEG